MKKLCIGSLLFIIVIFAAGIINLVNPNKPSVSLAENRKLQEKPVFSAASFFDKSYANNYSAYYSDTFILRDTLIQYRRAADKFFGFKKNMKIEISKPVNTPSPSALPINTVTYSPFPSPANTCTPATSQTEAPPSPTASVLPAPSPTPKPEYRAASAIEVLKSPFFLVDNNVVAAIWAKDESLKKYAMFINELKDSMGEHVNVYSMVIPTAMEYFNLSDMQYITGSQKQMVEDIAQYTNGSVIDVDAYNALFHHCKEYIYYKTDHHWTHLGAYYAYTALMQAMGKQEDIVPLESYVDKEVIEGFIGSAYRKTNQDERVLNNPDTLIAYYPLVEYKYIMHKKTGPLEKRLNDLAYVNPNNQYYNMFMSGGNGVYHEFTTENKNGRTILVICDSYGASFVHFLLPHYEKVYIMDTRFYDREYLNNMTIDAFAKSIHADDITTLLYMDSVAYTFNTDALYGLLK
jgi:hypothetical protein